MLTIVTPTLNSAKFLEKNIQSIASLDIPHQHIIVDGGSTDGTLEIINRFNHLVILNQREKLGMYHAIDMGFKEAVGSLLTWVNSDDMILKEGFERMYSAFQSAKCDVVYSDAHFVDSDGRRFKKIRGSNYAKFFLRKGIFPFVQPASIFTKELYYVVGGLDFTNFKIAGDLDLFHKFSRVKSASFKKVDVVTVDFLKYGESLGDKNTTLSDFERDSEGIPRPSLYIKMGYKLLSLL
jgi:glycosyltransferase involved in cell wall biosynthesis